MDKRTTGVVNLAADDGATVEREIEGIRGKLDRLVSELDDRRRRLSPSSLLRRHPSWFMLVGAALLGGATGAGLLARRARRRKLHSWFERGRRLQSSIEQVMAGKPIEQSPSFLRRALLAASLEAAAIAGRHLAVRIFGSRKNRD